MARSGMYDLILRVRNLTDTAGTAGTAIWTDEEIEDTLDDHKYRVHREELEREKTYLTNTTYEYRVFHSRYRDYEQGTAYFQVADSAGSARVLATDYTADYQRGVVTTVTDQAGTTLYLTGWSYDLNGAAADLWRMRAGKVSSYYSVDMDGHRLSRSDWFKHCSEMAEMYDRRSRPITVRPWRDGLVEDR